MVCKTLAIATVVFAVVLPVGVVVAATAQGQVQSITITKCGVRPGTCEGYVSVATPNGLQQVFVAPDTKIKRAGKPILLGELGIGNVVTMNGVQAVPGSSVMRPSEIEARMTG